MTASTLQKSSASLTASASNQIAGGLEEQHHGAFTYYLLKALTDGGRTTGQLFEYLKPKVEDSARVANRDQSPTMTGGDVPLR